MSLEEVILLHQIDRVKLRHDGVWCTCGEWSTGRGPGASEKYASHLAEMILQWKSDTRTNPEEK